MKFLAALALVWVCAVLTVDFAEPTRGARPSPSPVPCEPTEVEVTRVWFVRVKRADGVYGRIQVNARNWEAAGAEAANLSGAEPQSISPDTLTLGQVEWDE